MRYSFLLTFFFFSAYHFAVSAQESLVIKMKDQTTHIFFVEYISQMTLETPHPAEAIDLGLPSGTKWASWNVGASAPEEFGGYYAWGETEEKDYYDWSTYAYCDGSYWDCYYIGSDISGTEYDVAHVKWGGSWRMPTGQQIRELFDNCTVAWKTRNGVNGIVVSGPNGATIFLPAAGYRSKDDIILKGSYGYYWSSYLSSDSDAGDFYFPIKNYLGWVSADTYFSFRCDGQSVRAVCP